MYICQDSGANRQVNKVTFERFNNVQPTLKALILKLDQIFHCVIAARSKLVPVMLKPMVSRWF